MKPRRDILPDEQKKLWPQLAAARDLDFVLYGGLLLPCTFGHRLSVDFDFFSDRDLGRAILGSDPGSGKGCLRKRAVPYETGL